GDRVGDRRPGGVRVGRRGAPGPLRRRPRRRHRARMSPAPGPPAETASVRAARVDARTLRDRVLDAGSWVSWDAPIPPRDVGEGYAAELVAAAERSRQD